MPPSPPSTSSKPASSTHLNFANRRRRPRTEPSPLPPIASPLPLVWSTQWDMARTSASRRHLSAAVRVHRSETELSRGAIAICPSFRRPSTARNHTTTDAPETTEIVIFAERSPADVGASASGRSFRMHVERAAVVPHTASARAPPPDDPIPRRPPAFLIRDVKHTTSNSKLAPAPAPLKRQKAAELGSSVRLGAGEALFKVPELPALAQGNTKGRGKEGGVFDEVAAATKVKLRAEGGDAPPEKANRNVRTLYAQGLVRSPTHFFRLSSGSQSNIWARRATWRISRTSMTRPTPSSRTCTVYLPRGWICTGESAFFHS